MKRWIGILVWLLSVRLEAQEPASPLQFDAETFDFGLIDEADGPVTHAFRFICTADAPVRIDGVSTSCGCTTADYPYGVLQKGQVYQLKVTFDPAHTEGQVFREVEVFTTGRKSCDRLTLTATVNPAPMGLEQLYPLAFGDGVRAAMRHFSFGYIGQGETRIRQAVVVNTGDRPVALGLRVSRNDGILAADVPPTLPPGAFDTVRFVYTLQDRVLYGTMNDTVWLVIDGRPCDLPFELSAIGIDRLDESQPHSPKLTVTPAFCDLGEKAAGKAMSQSFTLSNDGDADLIIRAVELTPGVAADLRSGTVIRPRRSVRMVTTFTAPKETGLQTVLGVNLITNDPLRPRRDTRILFRTK